MYSQIEYTLLPTLRSFLAPFKLLDNSSSEILYIFPVIDRGNLLK